MTTRTRTAKQKRIRIWSRKLRGQVNKTCSPNVLCLPSAVGGAFMSKEQRFRLGLLYSAIAVLGAAYGIFEQPQAIDRLANSMKQSLPLMKEMLPSALLLILALVVYGLFRACRISH